MASFRKSYRQKLLVVTCLVATIGVISRVVHVGTLIWDKYLGDAVYAAVFYLVMSLTWSEGAVTVKAILATAYVVSVEIFQLTQIPAQLNQSANLVVRAFAYVVLGSAFGWWDMLAYGVGIGGIAWVDKLYLRADDRPGITNHRRFLC